MVINAPKQSFQLASPALHLVNNYDLNTHFSPQSVPLVVKHSIPPRFCKEMRNSTSLPPSVQNSKRSRPSSTGPWSSAPGWTAGCTPCGTARPATVSWTRCCRLRGASMTRTQCCARPSTTACTTALTGECCAPPIAVLHLPFSVNAARS